MDTLIFKTYPTEIKQLEGEQRQMKFLISTDAVDRDNDILDPKGWQLENFQKNPVVMFAHDYKSLPVAKCLAIEKVAKGVEATTEFPPRGVYAFADTVYDMVKMGFLNATSVGFRPLEYEQATDRKGFNFKTQELTEWSIVPIPSNPEALVQQRSVTHGQVRVWWKALKEWADKYDPPAAVALAKWMVKTGREVDLPGKSIAWLELPKYKAFEQDFLVETDDAAKALEDARLEKLLILHNLVKEPEEEPVVLTLIDDPNECEIKADLMKDVLASLGPELAQMIATEARTTINQMLGRID